MSLFTPRHACRLARGRRCVGALLIEALVVTLALAVTLGACAGGSSDGETPRPAGTTATPVPQAWSATVIDRRDGTVLYAKDADRRLPPASLVKIMTALVVLERVEDLGAYAEVPQIHLPQTVGVDLVPGDRITIEEALRALLVRSANDAALTLATFVAGSEPAFVKLMNDRARQLGMKGTHFTNCRGTAEPGNLSTAHDLAVLSRAAMKRERFREAVRLKTAVIHYPPDRAVPVENHNRLLRYAWADGIKTGSNDAALKCLAGSGQPGLVPLIVVTMHEPDREQEVEDAVALFVWASQLFERRVLVTAGDPVTSVPLAGGGEVALAARTSLAAVVRGDARVRSRLSVPASLDSRPAAGAVVGSVSYSSGGLDLGAVDLVAAASSPPAP